jgi:N,N-dimethylformamidase beta subunit-like protein/concanavalin A-like lectin/glucanase superfamily protein
MTPPRINGRPEPARAYRVPGVWGYADPINVQAGDTAVVHVSSPAACNVDFVRLRGKRLLDPLASNADDRADIDVLASFRHDAATPASIAPGSYIVAAGDPISPPFTIGLWLRVWRLPENDDLQWQWSGLISDLDYPEHCRYCLLVDHLGRVGFYLGDGGEFRHAWLAFAASAITDDVGRWVHIAASVDEEQYRIYLSGVLAGEWPANGRRPAASASSRLRIGASAEAGLADNFLDGDIAQPFVSRRLLGASELARVVADGGRSELSAIVPDLIGYWPLDEERGMRAHDASGWGRDGTIVNGGAWQIGGPAFDAADRGPTYDPATDPDRGHGLRLSSDDLLDCDWPETDHWAVPADAQSGTYAAIVTLQGAPQEPVAIPFVVVRRVPSSPGVAALLYSTNTWFAYGRRPSSEVNVAGLSASFYSSHANGRPFFHIATRAPIPRADPFGSESGRAGRTPSYHLVRPERYAEGWLRQQGYLFECITDLDLDDEPALLERFQALIICGHNEYWTDRMRGGLEKYLDQGGRVLSMSGNTLYWRASYDPATGVLESRKTVYGDDTRWLAPRWWGERFHGDGRPGGTWQEIGEPGYLLLGLDYQGMIDDGAPTSFAPFTVLAPDHFLFRTPEIVPLGSEAQLGARSLNGGAASGYEFDATPDRLGVISTPLEGLTVLASALDQLNIEWNGRDPLHGGDVIHWMRPAGGEVVSVGSIAFSGALAVDDASGIFVRNALSHFGIDRRDAIAGRG